MALGLKLAGAEVRVLATASGASSRTARDGAPALWRDIPYHTQWPGPPNSRFDRALRRPLRFLRPEAEAEGPMLRYMSELAKMRAVDIFLVYHQNPFIATRVALLCRRYSVKFVQQLVEWHEAEDYVLRWLTPNYVNEYLHIRFTPRLYDGSVVISELLRDTVSRSGRAGPLVVPALTNTEELPEERSSSGDLRRPVFTYLGAGARRDLLDVIIAGFGQFLAERKQGTLQLVGLAPRAAEHWREYVGARGLTANVRVRGWVTDPELAGVRGATDGYILLRQDGRSGRAAFPTRLPEFLVSGRPTITSAVGDVRKYLVDGDSAIVVRNTPAAVASGMRALADPQVARRIGSAGRGVALSRLSYKDWGKVLHEYLLCLFDEK